MSTTTTDEYTLEHTTDYDSLKLHRKNRKVNDHHLGNIIESVEEKNLLHLRPGAVGANNVVIDGQHRLKAAEKLKVPFYFIRDEQADIDDASTLNMHQVNWGLEQWEHYWIESGIEDYKRLKNFRTKNDLPTSVAISLTLSQSAHSSKKNNDIFRAGDYEYTHAEFAEEVAQMINDIDGVSKDITHVRTKGFILALLRAVKSGEYDHEHFMKKLEMRPFDLTRQATSKDYLRNIENIYNFKESNESRFF